MDYKEAIELLHPDTSRDAIWKISDEENAIKKIEEALVMACEGMKELQEREKKLTKERKAVEKQKAEKVTIEDVGYNQYRNVNLYACICPSCGLHIIEFDDDDVCESDSDNPAEMFRDCLVHHGYIGRNNYCDRCGQKLDWSEVEE